MICDFCGNVSENKRAVSLYMRAARITYIDCPLCGCALSMSEIRAAVMEQRYNHNHDSKGRFCFGSGSGGSSSKVLDKSAESGIIHYNSDTVIEDRKITGYLLNPERTHYKDFVDVGYSKDNPQKLYDDIVSNFNETKAVNHRINYDEYDTYSVFMELGVDKKARFRTVWEIKNKGDKPRLVSAHREDE